MEAPATVLPDRVFFTLPVLHLSLADTTAAYTSGMATPYAPVPRQVGILVLEADPKNSSVLKQILDSEGWRVRVVPDITLLHAELKTTEYSLLIANIA